MGFYFKNLDLPPGPLHHQQLDKIGQSIDLAENYYTSGEISPDLQSSFSAIHMPLMSTVGSYEKT
jgi:hypothetical protein